MRSLLSSTGNSLAAPRTERSNKLVLGLVALTVVTLLLAVDVPLERAITSIPLRGFHRDLLNVAEVFGNGFGVALVLMVIAVLDPLRRAALPRLAACSLGGGIAANVVKMLVERTRPRMVDLAGAEVWDTFTGIFPLVGEGSNFQGFPSAHSAAAAGLAYGLALLYPHGKRLFATLAVGVGLQRMFVSAHFPSDVVIGLAVGVATARALAPGGWLSGCFDRWERRATEQIVVQEAAADARKNQAA